MHSTMKLICKALFFVFLCVIVDTHARPASQSSEHDKHPRLIENIHHHVRTTARKRHAELRMTDAIARKAEELRRIAYLNGIMKSLGDNGDQSIKNVRYGTFYFPPHNGRPGYRYRAVKSFQVYPTPVPHTMVAPSALDQIDGVSSNGMRVVSNNPSRMSKTEEQYAKLVQQQQDAAATLRTCEEMRRLMAMNHIRVQVKCSNNLRHTTSPQQHAAYHNK